MAVETAPKQALQLKNVIGQHLHKHNCHLYQEIQQKKMFRAQSQTGKPTVQTSVKLLHSVINALVKFHLLTMFSHLVFITGFHFEGGRIMSHNLSQTYD